MDRFADSEVISGRASNTWDDMSGTQQDYEVNFPERVTILPFSQWQTQASHVSPANPLIPCISCDRLFHRFNEWIRHVIEVHHPECRLACPRENCRYSVAPTRKHRLKSHYTKAHSCLPCLAADPTQVFQKQQTWFCGFCHCDFDTAGWRSYGRHVWYHFQDGSLKRDWDASLHDYVSPSEFSQDQNMICSPKTCEPEGRKRHSQHSGDEIDKKERYNHQEWSEDPIDHNVYLSSIEASSPLVDQTKVKTAGTARNHVYSVKAPNAGFPSSGFRVPALGPATGSEVTYRPHYKLMTAKSSQAGNSSSKNGFDGWTESSQLQRLDRYAVEQEFDGWTAIE